MRHATHLQTGHNYPFTGAALLLIGSVCVQVSLVLVRFLFSPPRQRPGPAWSRTPQRCCGGGSSIPGLVSHLHACYTTVRFSPCGADRRQAGRPSGCRFESRTAPRALLRLLTCIFQAALGADRSNRTVQAASHTCCFLLEFNQVASFSSKCR